MILSAIKDFNGTHVPRHHFVGCSDRYLEMCTYLVRVALATRPHARTNPLPS